MYHGIGGLVIDKEIPCYGRSSGSKKNIMVLEEWLMLEKYHGTNHGTGGVVVHGANIFSTARGQLKSWRGSDYVMVG